MKPNPKMPRKKPTIAAAKPVRQSRPANTRHGLPDEEEITALAETFAALSDPTRLKIVRVLQNQELCVQKLADRLKLSPSATSHQLRLLRTQRLVKCRRDGQQAFYTLDDDHIFSLLRDATEHINEK